MVHLIDRDVLVAEIERKRTKIKEYCLREGHDTRFDVVPEQLSFILAFIDSLEVKEVDLEKEIDKIDDAIPGKREDIEYIAKHFFELGIKAQKGE